MPRRYAVYYAPRPGVLADLAGHWLGRDVGTGGALPQPQVSGLPVALADVTGDPRLYGFHGTLRAPFRLATTASPDDVAACVADLAARSGPVLCQGLSLENLDGFLALTPQGDKAALGDLAARVVAATDPLRSPLNADELARRRPETLTTRQRALLDRWGYPFVMEEFRFHLTLTDRLAAAHLSAVMAAAEVWFAPVMRQPFAVEDLCLFGQGDDGLFRLLHRYALSG